jgi:hypothetical protein
MRIYNFLKISSSEFIQKEKGQNVSQNKESKGELLLLSTLVSFMNHGDGMKEKISSKRF